MQDVCEDEQQESCHDDEEEGEVGGRSYRVAFESAHLCRYLCAYQDGERNVDQDTCHQDDKTAQEPILKMEPMWRNPHLNDLQGRNFSPFSCNMYLGVR